MSHEERFLCFIERQIDLLFSGFRIFCLVTICWFYMYVWISFSVSALTDLCACLFLCLLKSERAVFLSCCCLSQCLLSERTDTEKDSNRTRDKEMQNTLQHTATHCNTLQHTATHCNTLQHTATHCNTGNAGTWNQTQRKTGTWHRERTDTERVRDMLSLISQGTTGSWNPVFHFLWFWFCLCICDSAQMCVCVRVYMCLCNEVTALCNVHGSNRCVHMCTCVYAK